MNDSGQSQDEGGQSNDDVMNDGGQSKDDVMVDNRQSKDDITNAKPTDITSQMETETETESSSPPRESDQKPISKSAIDNISDDVASVTISSLDSTAVQIDQLIERLSLSDAHFKHQQRGEPDLTAEQKSAIARTMFDQQPIKFLSQFGKYLTHKDIPCFEHLKDDPTIKTYLEELAKTSRTTSKQRIMNRRYQAMKLKTEEGSYFSEEAMKHRDPLLYEQMVGQYLPKEERAPPREIDKSDHRFSTILMEFMDKCDDDELYKAQKEREEEQEEESESETDEDEKEEEEGVDMEPQPSTSVSGTSRAGSTEAPPVDITEEERSLLREEFLHTMQERFMAGQERDFDYRTVDDNADYDPIDIRGQDEEEKYFDDMEPESVSPPGGLDDDDDLDSDSECWTKPSLAKYSAD